MVPRKDKIIQSLSLKVALLTVIYSQTTLNRVEEPCECGVLSRDRRIVGGEEASASHFPWNVLLVTNTSDQVTGIKCGGTLISTQHVLTAAHCLHNISTSFSVLLGNDNWKAVDKTRSVLLPMSKVSIHEHYNNIHYTDDIAIIKLANPVSYTNYIRPACLPPSGMNLDNVKVQISGWGKSAMNLDPSNVLRSATIPVVATKDCLEKYKKYYPNLGEPTICAFDSEVPTGACQGDSGGPLVYDCNGRFTLVGVISSGKGCEHTFFPTVAMNVSHYLDWIQSKTIGAKLCESHCFPPPIGELQSPTVILDFVSSLNF